jgi:hypothetical protein
LRHRAMWRTGNKGQKRSRTAVEFYPHVVPASSTQVWYTAAPIIPILSAPCRSATRARPGRDDITPPPATPAEPCRESWRIWRR